MELNEDDIIERLINCCGFHRSYATALVRSEGKCEYCERNLLCDRFEYSVSTLDHLLPKSKYPECVAENECNWVFCCGPCNSTKHTWDPNETVTPVASPDDLRHRRQKLILAARCYIKKRNEKIHDPVWDCVLAAMKMPQGG